LRYYQVQATGEIGRSVYGDSLESAKNVFTTEQQKAEKEFLEFEQRFPDSNLIPKLRFMVGNSYWYTGDKSGAKPWLEEGSKVGDDEHTFWSHLSKLRLAHWR
jgi:TolA-binding protein